MKYLKIKAFVTIASFPRLTLSLTSPCRSSLLPEGGIPRLCSFVASDFHLHRLVLSHRLRSSFYSSFLSLSIPFYDDASLRLGQALLGPCAFFPFYINCSTSCIVFLTLTYSISPRIYQGHYSLSWISLSPRRTIESTLLWTLRTPGVRLDAWTPKEQLLGWSPDQSSLRLYLPGPSVTASTEDNITNQNQHPVECRQCWEWVEVLDSIDVVCEYSRVLVWWEARCVLRMAAQMQRDSR